MANPRVGGKPALMSDACAALPVTDHERIACGLHMASRGLSAALAHAAKPHGLSGAEANLLLKMDLGLNSPSEIANWLGIDASNLSRMMRKLEELGLLKREVDDANRSRVNITLTNSGKKKAAALKPGVRAMEKQALAALTAKELKELKGLLQKLCVGLLES